MRVLDVAQALREVGDERPGVDDLRALERRAGGQGAGGRAVELVEDRVEALGDVLGLATGRELPRAERERRRVVGAGAVRERAVEGVAPQQDPEAQQRRRARAAKLVVEGGGSHASEDATGPRGARVRITGGGMKIS